MAEELNREFFVNAGKKGGNSTKEKFGTAHYKKIGSKRKKVKK